MQKKSFKKCEKYFYFVLKKYQSVAHVSTYIFQGIFKNIVFRSVTLVIKKLFIFLRRLDFLSTLCIKKIL